MTEDQPSAALKTLAALHEPLLKFTQQFLTDNGFQLPEDGQAARDWCRSRAVAGDADAQLAYAQLLRHGLFGTRNVNETFLWIQRAVDQSHAAAMMALSPYVEMGHENCRSDTTRALSLIQASADKGYAPAWAALATWYELGPHVEVNPELAMEYHRKGASLGLATSQYKLGVDLMRHADGSEKEEGIAWLQAAAQQGFYLAHEALGRIFAEKEFGLPIDQERSRHHHEMAKRLEDEAGAAFGIGSKAR